MQTIREAFERTPETVGELMLKNDRYVFFKEYEVDQWPLASLGVPLTAGVSLATDKTVYPPGGLVLVRTPMVSDADGTTWTARFLLDQDSGGAIKGPGRADIFEGIGEEAGRLAPGRTPALPHLPRGSARPLARPAAHRRPAPPRSRAPPPRGPPVPKIQSTWVSTEPPARQRGRPASLTGK